MRGGRRRERAGHGPRRRARQCGGAGSGPRLDVRDAEPAPSHPPRSDPLRVHRARGGRQRPGGLDEGRYRIRDELCAGHRRRVSARLLSCRARACGARPRRRNHHRRSGAAPSAAHWRYRSRAFGVLDDRAKLFGTDGTATRLGRPAEELALGVGGEQGEAAGEVAMCPALRRGTRCRYGLGSESLPWARGVLERAHRVPLAAPRALRPAHQAALERARSGSDNLIDGYRNGFPPTQACVDRLRNPQINL